MLILLGTVGVAGVLAAGPARTIPGENAVLEWNRYALQATVTANQGPLPQMRSMAIVQVSMNDAVQAIAGGVDTYLSAGDPPIGASAEAAAIAAAHYALTALFPPQDFDAQFADSLAARQLDPTDPGVAFGQAVAASVLSLRSTDGASVAQYRVLRQVPARRASGRQQPDVRCASGWGDVDPFVMHSGSQFRPDGPPSLDSGRYARDYNEVKDYGSISSTLRTSDQSNIARFWLATPSALANPLARDVIAARNLDLSDTARVLALMYMAGTDASLPAGMRNTYASGGRRMPSAAAMRRVAARRTRRGHTLLGTPSTVLWGATATVRCRP
jgi:hypothetical protein